MMKRIWTGVLVVALSSWVLGCTDPDKQGGQDGHDHSTHQHDGGGIEAPEWDRGGSPNR